MEQLPEWQAVVDILEIGTVRYQALNFAEEN